MFRVCLNAKSQNVNLNFSLLKGLIKNYGKYPSFWLLHLPFLLLPYQIYNSKIIRRMYRIVKKRYKKLP